MKEPQPDGAPSMPLAIKTRSNSGAGLGGVEAIFLSSADPEEGAGGENASVVTQELWRQKHAQEEEEAGRTRKKLSTKSGKQKQQSADASLKQDQQKSKEKDDKLVQVSNKQAAGQRPPVAAESTSSGKRNKQKHQQNGEEFGGDVQHQNGRNSLRKTRSVTDVDGERESQVSSAASSATGRRGGRRMSISVASPHHQYSMGSSSRDSSRRSSAASIVISVSRPDSPLPHLIQRIGEETLSIEFLRIRKTAKAIHSASKFRNPHCVIQAIDDPTKAKMSSEETAANLIRMHKERRNSMPTVPRLDLKDENEKDGRKQKKNKDGSVGKNNKRLADGQQTCRSRRRRSSTGSSIQGFYMPASRPSSAMAGNPEMMDPLSRPSSAATIVQLGKLSRPWTPARSPSPASGTGSANRYGAGSRNFFRSRTPTSMAAPLQALNTKVNNILGCASNILDFYHQRPDIKKEPDQRRQGRLIKSMKMNEATEEETEETAQSRLIKFRKKAGQGNPGDKVRETKLISKPAIQPIVSAPTDGSFAKKQLINTKKLLASKSNNKEKTISKVATIKPTPEPVIEQIKQEHNKTEQIDKEISKGNVKLPMLSTTMTITQKTFHALMTSKGNKTVLGNLSVTAGGGSSISLNSAVSSQSSGTQAKGVGSLKSMMDKKNTKTAVVAAAAFSGKSPSSSMTKFKMKKALKVAKTAGMVARRKPTNTGSHNQSTQNNTNNQGPPTLVNFFKRSNRANNTDSRIPIKYETFTDKDRAAAVLLGDADIKTTLEKQLKSGICLSKRPTLQKTHWNNFF